MAAAERVGPRPKPRILVLGIVLLLVAPVVYEAAVILGASEKVEAGPASTQLDVAALSSYSLCNLAWLPPSGLVECPTQGPGASGSVLLGTTVPYFDAASGNTVVVTSPSWISIRNGVQGPEVAPTFNPPCAPEAIFPGAGDEVTISCYSTEVPDNGSLLFVNTSTGLIDAILPLPANMFVPVADYAWVPGSDSLYLGAGYYLPQSEGSAWAGTLLAIDAATHSRMRLPGLAPDPGPSALTWDPIHDAVVFYNATFGGLEEFSAVTGAVTPVVATPSLPYALTVSSTGQDLLVGLPAGSNPTWWVDLTTFRVVDELRVGAYCGAIPDPTTASIAVSDCEGFSEIDAATGTVLGPADLGSPTWFGGWTLDAATGQFILGDAEISGDPSVDVADVALVSVPGPSYGAIPGVGTDFPTAAGAACATLGALLLAGPGIGEGRAVLRYDDALEAERWTRRWRWEEERRRYRKRSVDREPPVRPV
jgi:hypothetical protein